MLRTIVFGNKGKGFERRVPRACLTIAAHVTKDRLAVTGRDFSFSGSGFLCVYHLGVASTLIQKKIITADSQFAGASGGALVATALACNIPIEKALEMLFEIAADCRKNGTIGRAGRPLMKALDKIITDDSTRMCQKRVKVAVTRVWPSLKSPELIDEFSDRDDLLLALKSSCFIPFYLGRGFSVKWRGGMYVDGGFVEIIPIVPSYAMVLVFQPDMLRPVLPASVRRSRDLISPSLTADFPFHMGGLVRRALLPASDKELTELFEWGQRAGEVWADQQK